MKISSKNKVRLLLLVLGNLDILLTLVYIEIRLGGAIFLDVAPTMLFSGFWITQAIQQSQDLKNDLIKNKMESSTASDVAYGEFRRSFFLETMVLEIVNVFIITVSYQNRPLSLISMVIVGGLSVSGYVFSRSTSNYKFLTPALAITVCSVLGGQLGYFLETSDNIVNFIEYTMVSFIAVDGIYFSIKYFFSKYI